MTEEELAKKYAETGWGKLVIAAGFEPTRTESSARRVADYVAENVIPILLEAKKNMGCGESEIYINRALKAMGHVDVRT